MLFQSISSNLAIFLHPLVYPSPLLIYKYILPSATEEETPLSKGGITRIVHLVLAVPQTVIAHPAKSNVPYPVSVMFDVLP